MATALEVVTNALQLIGVKKGENPITPLEAQDGLTSLNDMMAEWEEQGIYTGFVPLSDTDDELIVPRFALGAIKAKLAIYVAAEYDRTITPALAARSIDSFSTLKAALLQLSPAEYPDTLPVGSGNYEHTQTDGDAPNNTADNTFYPENVKRNF